MLKRYGPVLICSAFKRHAKVLAYAAPFEFNECCTQTSEIRTCCLASLVSKILRMEIRCVGREETLSFSCMLLSCFGEWSETKECTKFAFLYKLFCSEREKKAIFDPILVPRSDQERSITSLPPGHQWSYLYCDNICRTQLKLDHCVVAVAKSLCSKQTRQRVWGETTRWWQAYHPTTGQNRLWNKALLSFLRSLASETPELVFLQPELLL